MDSINTCLLLLNAEINNQRCTKDELNDSIDLFMGSKISERERRIAKYLQGMGIQTKTDPELKEQQYWSQRKIESNKKLEEYWSCQKLSSNSSIGQLLVESPQLTSILTEKNALFKHSLLPDLKSKRR